MKIWQWASAAVNLSYNLGKKRLPHHHFGQWNRYGSNLCASSVLKLTWNVPVTSPQWNLTHLGRTLTSMRYAWPKFIFTCHIKNHLKLNYGYRNFQNNIVCYCNVNTNKTMGILNETKNVIHFRKITISLKKWYFLTYFTKQDKFTPGQVLAIAEVLCVIMIPF